MPPIKLLYRAARRLHDVWMDRATRAASPERLARERVGVLRRAFDEVGRRLAKARTHGLPLILPGLRQQLCARAADLAEALHQLVRELERPTEEPPSVLDLLAELRQLEDEFGGLRIDGPRKALCVTTEPITLKGVALGRFEIRFFGERLAGHANAYCFDVAALDPNPAVTDGRVTHPHVKAERLCAGDTTESLRLALEQGRLADAFCLVRAVLSHYNAGSPHVSLEEWDGLECHDCGTRIPRPIAWQCDSCGHDYCPDCGDECGACRAIRCGECLQSCAACDGRYCAGCLRPSAHSGRECCRQCLRRCPACGATVALDELDDEGHGCLAGRQGPHRPDDPLPSLTPDPLEPETTDGTSNPASTAP